MALSAPWRATCEQDFSFVLAEDPATKKKSSETGYGAFLAYTYVGRTYLWTAGYSHEESYKAGDKVEICTPIGTTGSTSFSEGTVGSPKKQPAELAFLESRWICFNREARYGTAAGV
jgi:hypothetical protein